MYVQFPLAMEGLCLLYFYYFVICVYQTLFETTYVLLVYPLLGGKNISFISEIAVKASGKLLIVYCTKTSYSLILGIFYYKNEAIQKYTIHIHFTQRQEIEATCDLP